MKKDIHPDYHEINIVMTDGTRTLTIPRHNPINAFTMGRIVVDAGMSIDEFRRYL